MPEEEWEGRIRRIQWKEFQLKRLKKELAKEIFIEATHLAKKKGYRMCMVGEVMGFRWQSYQNGYYQDRLSIARAKKFYHLVEVGVAALDKIVDLNKGRVPKMSELRAGSIAWKKTKNG